MTINGSFTDENFTMGDFFPKFSKSSFRGSGDRQGFVKVSIFTAKGTSLRKFTSIKLFFRKNRLRGLTSRLVVEKIKSQRSP